MKNMNKKNSFPKEDVVKLYRTLESLWIQIWIDGGWWIDILIWMQSREHEDIDIVIEECHLAQFLQYTSESWYRDHPRDDTCDWNFVLENTNGLLIDVHVVVFDENWKGIYWPKERWIFYPASAFTWKWTIDGVSLRCISAENQIDSHSGYTLREKDYQDIRLLCEYFKIPLPLEYR
jgi:lincosamide nucleotidyltransferase A/C/D/E